MAPEDSWIVKCLGVGAATVALALYTRLVATRARAGAARLRLLAPVLVAFTLLPLAFRREDEMLSRASAAAILFWLANLKVLLLALGRGPLADATLRLDEFLALLLWPILHLEGPGGRVLRWEEHALGAAAPADLTPRQKLWRRRGAAAARATHRLAENVLIVGVGAVTLVTPAVPLFLKTYSSAFGVYAYCDIFANLAAALVIWLHGLAVAPSWDRPWRQNCLSDFWTRRWNLPAAYSLRALVYEPILERRLVKAATAPPPPPPPPASPPHAQERVGGDDGGTRRPVAEQAELTDVAVQRVRSAAAPGRFVATVTSPAGAEPAGPAQGAEERQEEGGGGHVSSVVARLVSGEAAHPPRRASVMGTGTMDEEVQAAEELVSLMLDTPADAPRPSSPPAPNSAQGAESPGASVRRRRTHAAHSPRSSTPPPEGVGAGAGAGAPVAAPSPRRRATAPQRLAAMAATFAASGLLHEALILLCCGWEAWRRVAGRHMLYFLLQVPNTVVEQQLHRLCKAAKWTPPDLLAVPVTSLSLQVPGLWLFWKPIWTAALIAMGKTASV